MSVLSFPRIYFKGFMEWDPCTFNNNDWQEFPTYDGVNAALNWPFLATQGITQQNFYTTLRPWAIALQPDCTDSPSGDRLPAEWNMFGSHSVKFVQQPSKGFVTTITGGALSASGRVTKDAIIGRTVAITGDRGGSARLVDTNPASFWSSQIYFAGVQFGDGDCMISGPRQFRMHSRWLDLSRIYSSDQELTAPAAGVGACFQTAIRFDDVKWPAAGTSALADALRKAAATKPAAGIMVRFTAYVNVYFANGILNEVAPRPRNYQDLANALTAAWNEFNSTGKTHLFFSNPCYSHVVGTIGVWDKDELATVPAGRYLAGANAVAPRTSKPAQPVGHAQPQTPAANPVMLGPVVVHIDYDAQLISLDLNSTIPELGTPGAWPSDLEKADFGALDFGVLKDGMTFTPIASIAYDRYARGAYETSAGIVDIPFPNSDTAALLQSGALAIQVQQRTALAELPYSAQTDYRGIYVNQRETSSFPVTVYDLGAPSPHAKVLIAQYDQGLNLLPSQAAPLVTFAAGTMSTVVTTDAHGGVWVDITACTPGFAVLAFFPFTGDTPPTPPPALLGPAAPANASITYAFYTTVRVLPFDDALPRQFVDLWNATRSSTRAWQFIYNRILYLYDMIFNVMLTVFNLGSQSSVEANIGPIWHAISATAAQENTQAMPITRDLSDGKRRTLQLWIYLVANQFDVPAFNVNSIPKGWQP